MAVAKLKHPTTAERRFMSGLRKIAKVVGGIVAAHVDFDRIEDVESMKRALDDYSRLLVPWARRASRNMIEEVSIKNLSGWDQASKRIGRDLRSVFAESFVGAASARDIHEKQVSLITSIPPDAGARAQALAQQAATSGVRNEEIARKLARTEGTTLARARLIARTETAKVNAALTQARAKYVGASRYFWRTMEDADVRDAHQEMGDRSNEGETFSFDDPPEVGDEGPHGPGEFPNCRCWAEVVIPDPAEEEAA